MCHHPKNAQLWAEQPYTGCIYNHVYKANYNVYYIKNIVQLERGQHWQDLNYIELIYHHHKKNLSPMRNNAIEWGRNHDWCAVRVYVCRGASVCILV